MQRGGEACGRTGLASWGARSWEGLRPWICHQQLPSTPSRALEGGPPLKAGTQMLLPFCTFKITSASREIVVSILLQEVGPACYPE